MSKHTITGFVYTTKYEWDSKTSVNFLPFAPIEDEETAIVGPHSFEVEVPDDFNPIPQQVAALEEKKRLARLALAKELADLDDRIGKLTCITFAAEPETSDDGITF